MTGDAWDTDLGRWALAWRDYRRGVANPAPASSSPVVESDGDELAREIKAALDAMDARMKAITLAGAPDAPVRLVGLYAWLTSDANTAADEAFAREIALAHEVVDPKGLLPWLASLPESGDGTVGSDAKYRQMLAEEVCDDAVAADAATAFVPDVPLPFGGEEFK